MTKEQKLAQAAWCRESWKDPEIRHKRIENRNKTMRANDGELYSIIGRKRWESLNRNHPDVAAEAHRKAGRTYKDRYATEPEFRKRRQPSIKKWIASAVTKEANEHRSNTCLRQFREEGRIPSLTAGPKSTIKQWVVTKKAGRVWSRSSWERLLFRLLDKSPLIRTFQVEPFPIQYRYKGKAHNYYPDVLIETTEGDKFLVELKGFDVVPVRNAAKHEAARVFCELNGIEFKLFTEKVESLSALVQ